MCGLYGLIRAPQRFRKGERARLVSYLDGAGTMSAARGIDATGLTRWDADEEKPTLRKGAIPVWEMIFNEEYRDAVDTMTAATFVMQGHTRAATLGKASDHALAQPFRFKQNNGAGGHVSVTHNGTVNGYRNLRPNGTVYKNDSKTIAAALADAGRAGEVEIFRRIEKLNGAAALVVARRDDDGTISVTLTRNSQRPLWVAGIKGLPGVMLYASTSDILRRAARGSQLTLVKEQEIRAGQAITITPKERALHLTREDWGVRVTQQSTPAFDWTPGNKRKSGNKRKGGVQHLPPAQYAFPHSYGDCAVCGDELLPHEARLCQRCDDVADDGDLFVCADCETVVDDVSGDGKCYDCMGLQGDDMKNCMWCAQSFPAHMLNADDMCTSCVTVVGVIQ